MTKTLYVLLLLLTGLLTVLIQQNFTITKQEASKPLAKEYLRDLALYRYDPQGLITSHLSANEWEFVPQQQYSLLTNPRLLLYRPPEVTYIVEAERGKIIHPEHGGQSNQIKVLQLSSAVKLQQVPATRQTAGSSYPTSAIITTNYLEFNPQTNIISTKQPIKLLKPDLTVTSDGMRLHINTRQLELFDNVTSTYSG